MMQEEDCEQEICDPHAEFPLIRKAYDYLTNGSYPPGATKNEKRVIRKKATKLIVRNGEYFYKRKGGREVSILSYN